LRYYGNEYLYESYNIQNNPVSNLPFTIPLYFLNSSIGTGFHIYYTDFNYLTHPNIIMQIQRQYLAQNLYNTIEIPVTSQDGSTTGSFNTNNIRYKIIMIEKGVIIDTFNDVYPSCQSLVLATCNLYLRGSEIPITANGTDFTYTLTLGNNSLTLTYIIPSGTPKIVEFTTNQNSRFLNNISSCSSSVFGSGGTITCTYNNTIGDSLINTQVLINNASSLYGQVPIAENLSGFFLLNNYFIAFILILLLGLIFISSGVFMTISAAVGLLFLMLIFVIGGVDMTSVIAGIVWLIIAAVIIIYKIAQKEERT